MNDKKLMNLAADNIRILAASMVECRNKGNGRSDRSSSVRIDIKRIQPAQADYGVRNFG